MYDDTLRNNDSLSLDEVLDDILSTPTSSPSLSTQGVEPSAQVSTETSTFTAPSTATMTDTHTEEAGQKTSDQVGIQSEGGESSQTKEEQVPQEMNPRIRLLKRALEEIQKHTAQALSIIAQEEGTGEAHGSTHDALLSSLAHLVTPPPSPSMVPESVLHPLGASSGERIIEGVFDGQGMRGPDGMQYTIPANYASKSKLVEGDIMKLTITPQGTFLYKQIGPIGRKRVIGTLTQDPNTREYEVVLGEQRWRILTASVTYYKGVIGDDVVVLIPAEGTSHWGAVENIIKKF